MRVLEGIEISGEQPRANHRSEPRQSRDATRQIRGRLRLTYFSIASLWGFLIGAGAFAIGPAVLGPSGGELPMLMVVVPAAAVAILGGVVAARAYREASGRLR